MKVLPFTIPTNENILKLREILNNLIEEVPIQVEIQKHLATITRAKYLALIDEGFTPDQAIQLCK